MPDPLTPESAPSRQAPGFEDLLWDLFLQLMDVPAERVEAQILSAQRHMCRALDLDRSGLWQTLPEHPDALWLTHIYDVEHDSTVAAAGDGAGERWPEFLAAARAPARHSNAAMDFPWLASRALRGQTTVIDSLAELPPEAAVDAAMLTRLATGSSVIFPLAAHDTILGCLSFATVHRTRSWPPELVARFERVAQVFAKALARKRADEQLRDREARLELTVSSAEAGLWDLDLRTGRIRGNDLAKRLLGFSADEDVDVEKVLAAVHPEDRDLVRQRIEWVRLHQEGYGLEYRVQRPDGSVRWLSTRGRPYGGPTGESERVLGVTIDVTESRHAEQLVRESRVRLAAAVDVAALGCFELRGASRLVFADERMRALLGAGEDTSADAFWQFWMDHVHAEDRPRVAEFSRRMRQEGLDSVVTEYRYEHPQLGARWFHHASRVLERDADGRLERLVGVLRDVTEGKHAEEALRSTLAEVAQLKDRLEAENVLLHQEVRHAHGFDTIVGRSEALGRVLSQVEHVAATEAPVLLLGETGTGKDLVARAIHDRSRRRQRSMVTVNCAALPAALIESELFGYEKGAFTGALQRVIGRFEVADGGTLFLDEIGEVPLELQAKLLRVLQSGEFERLGSPRTYRSNVRVIAATNRDLEAERRAGRFRSDLFYRLSVFPIRLPPLRERREDVPLLVWHFVSRKQARLGKVIKRIPERVMRSLTSYAWPGNVRELENVIERALILSEGSTLTGDPALFGAGPGGAPEAAGSGTLEDVERAHIRAVLAECGWKIAGRGNAAERLGLNRSTLQFRIRKLGIERPDREG
jgi:PAS domain S-box-containing protein